MAKKKTKRRGITKARSVVMPADWWAEFERAAFSEGKSLSLWIGRACKRALPVSRVKGLSERPRPGRPVGK